MHYRISCPSCSMNASTSDHRHFSPAGVADGNELRRCRNCGDIVSLEHISPDAGRRRNVAFSQAS